MDSAATTLVSVWNTLVMGTAVMALTERCTICPSNTLFLSPRHWVAMPTYLLPVVPRYAPSERHVCYSLCIGCCYIFTGYTKCGNIYNFFLRCDQLYLSAVAIYWMVHLPHICLALRYCHILQYSLRFGYISFHCSCFAIVVFYRSEVSCRIFTLSSTIPAVLHIPR